MDWLKLSIFDLDGTLIEHEHDFFIDRVLAVADRFGHDELCPVSLDDAYRKHQLLEHLEINRHDRGAVAEFFLHLNQIEWPEARLIDGSLEVLDELLRAGHHIALATAREQTREEVVSALKGTGLLPYLSIISTWSETDWNDKVEQIHQVCAAKQIAPKDASMIGDSPSDITSGRKAGVAFTAAVLTGGMYRTTLEASAPHVVLDSVLHLPESYRSVKLQTDE